MIWRRASLGSDSTHGLRLRRRRSSVESQISIIKSPGKGGDGSGQVRHEKVDSSQKRTGSPLVEKSIPKPRTKSPIEEETRLKKMIRFPLYVLSFLLFLLQYFAGLIFYSANSKLFLGFCYYTCYPYAHTAMLGVARLKDRVRQRGGKRLWMMSVALWLISFSLLLFCMKWMRSKSDPMELEQAKVWTTVKERANFLEQIQDWEHANHDQMQTLLQELNYLL